MSGKIFTFAVLILLACSGCVDVATEPPPIVLPEFVTATLPPTSIPLPTPTSAPATAAPTLPPIEGTTTTQVNVRAETNTASESYGVIPAFNPLQVTGKDATGTWYQIAYSESPVGTGWVRAEFVQVESSAEIQVQEIAAGFGSGASGLVVSGINVRNGPGTDFESLGVLTAKDVVWITGRDESGAWLQIVFTKSPDGTGWAAAEFLQAESLDSLPVLSSQTQATDMPETSEATLMQTAAADGDSPEAPLVNGSLSPFGARVIVVQNDVSSPDGDTEDWVTFSSLNIEILLQVSCPSGGLLIELKQETSSDSFSIACGSERRLSIVPDKTYHLRISSDGAQYIRYVLKIEAGD